MERSGAMAAEADEWWQQLAQTLDRMLSRVHLSDPLLYAELLNVRRGLEPSWDMGARPFERKEATWTIARR